MTHDRASASAGDGPTHQAPVELCSSRDAPNAATPNLNAIRPADAVRGPPKPGRSPLIAEDHSIGAGVPSAARRLPERSLRTDHDSRSAWSPLRAAYVLAHRREGKRQRFPMWPPAPEVAIAISEARDPAPGRGDRHPQSFLDALSVELFEQQDEAYRKRVCLPARWRGAIRGRRQLRAGTAGHRASGAGARNSGFVGIHGFGGLGGLGRSPLPSMFGHHGRRRWWRKVKVAAVMDVGSAFGRGLSLAGRDA